MKKQLHFFFVIICTLLVFESAIAQNPKTNAGNLNKKTSQGYQSPTIPKAPSKSQYKNDSIYRNNSDTTFRNNFDSISKAKSDSIKNLYSNIGLVDFGIIVGISQNEYKKVSNDDVGIGLGLTVMHNFLGNAKEEKSPVNIYLGGTFEYLYFGGSISMGDPYTYFVGSSRFDNKTYTSVNLSAFTLMASSRIEFFTGSVIPFFEVAAGGRLFGGTENITVTQTETKNGIVSDPVEKKFHNNLESALTGCYGYGGGIRIGSYGVSLEFKLMNYRGTTATYVDNESITIDPITNQVSYTTKTSTTDLLIPQISISGTF